MGNRVFDGKKHRLDVDIHHLVPLTAGVLMEGLDIDHACIVDKNVQAAKLPGRAADGIAHRAFAADIAGDGQDFAAFGLQFPGNFSAQGNAPPDQRHLCAFTGK